MLYGICTTKDVAIRTVFAREHFLFGELNKVSSTDCDDRVSFTFRLTLSQSLYEGSPQLQNNVAINLCGVLTLHSSLLDLSLLSTLTHSFRPLSLSLFYFILFIFICFLVLLQANHISFPLLSALLTSISNRTSLLLG